VKPREYADLMYQGPHSKRSHWVPWGLARALCGAETEGGHTHWFGTGSMDEFDRAEGLTLCTECATRGAS
jgi:hypothetical protein